jgi:anhydro-N-acetylmuramic acid kinase
MMKENLVLGLMSGTSLDGVDAALCSYYGSGNKWSYRLHYAETIPYSAAWKNALSGAFGLNGRELTRLDIDFGKYLGQLSNEVLIKSGLNVGLIASHGHTVFHDPDNHYTLQIGNGSNLAMETGLPVVCNFRVTDVALGGQGAPLVPVGDRYLFHEYQSCLNLGGFANISFDREDERVAFDICPVNIVLNYLAAQTGNEMDLNGNLGRSGRVNNALLKQLNQLEYYGRDLPKSLGREWVENQFLPLMNTTPQIPLADKFRTVYQHIVNQLVLVVKQYKLKNMLITGGGVHNLFLRELILEDSAVEITIPDQATVDFKEAIIFGFLGLLRIMNRVNCFASVTGAGRDSVCGAVYLP